MAWRVLKYTIKNKLRRVGTNCFFLNNRKIICITCERIGTNIVLTLLFSFNFQGGKFTVDFLSFKIVFLRGARRRRVNRFFKNDRGSR